MKMRPDFTVHPGLITVPPTPAGDAQHARARVFAVLWRCFASDQHFYMVVARSTDSAVFVQTGEDKSAAVLTKQLRVLCRRLVESLPAGVIVASHSWREMAATACFLAKYDSIRMASHGFWQNVGTMYDSYIKPYKKYLLEQQASCAAVRFSAGSLILRSRRTTRQIFWQYNIL